MQMRSDEPTVQERAVLEAIIEAGTIGGAARLLHLSPHTVDAHLDTLRAKARKRYLAQVVAWACTRGFVMRPAGGEQPVPPMSQPEMPGWAVPGFPGREEAP